MARSSDPLQRLTVLLKKLPGVGPKSAQRLALFVLRAPRDYVGQLAEALETVRDKVRLCACCCDVTEDELCALCADARRDRSTICVVEQPTDVRVLEKTGEYSGTYHVLHGALSPLDVVKPSDLKIAELLARVRQGGVKEVILAMNANTEGDVTATYLAQELAGLDVAVTRIATGMPAGGELEYADPVTLARALGNRRQTE